MKDSKKGNGAVNTSTTVKSGQREESVCTFGDTTKSKTNTNFAFDGAADQNPVNASSQPQLSRQSSGIKVYSRKPKLSIKTRLERINQIVEESVNTNIFQQKCQQIRAFLGDYRNQIIESREIRSTCFDIIDRPSRQLGSKDTGTEHRNSQKVRKSPPPPSPRTNQTNPQQPRSPYQPPSAGLMPNSPFRRPMTEEEKQLHDEIGKSAGKWLEHKKKEDAAGTYKALKESKMLLNKLTPDNFDDLKNELLTLASKSRETCEIVASDVISKAWAEMKYVGVYARLCLFLGVENMIFFEGDDKSAGRASNSFRKMILKSLQDIFEAREAPEQRKQSSDESKEELEKRAIQLRKKKLLGNVLFLAELTLLKFMPKKIVHMLTFDLMHKFIVEYFDFMTGVVKPIIAEETIEAVITLYTKIGQFLENQPDPQSNNHDPAPFQNSFSTFLNKIHSKPPGKIDLDEMFPSRAEINLTSLMTCLAQIRAKSKLGDRIKLLIKNLEERRKNDWKNTSFHVEGPKTIAELHEDHARKQADEQAFANKPISPRPSMGISRPPLPGMKMSASGKRLRNSEAPLPKPPKLAGRSSQASQDSSRQEIEEDLKLTKSTSAINSAISKVMNEDDGREGVRKLLERIDNDEMTDENLSTEVEGLIKANGKGLVVQCYLELFFDAPRPKALKRLEMFNVMMRDGIQPIDFFPRLDVAIRRVASGRCDYPLLPQLLAKVVVQYLKENKKTFVEWKPEIQANHPDFDDIAGLIQDIYSEASGIAGEDEEIRTSLQESISFLNGLSSVFDIKK